MKIVKSLIAAVATLLVSGASMAAVYEVPLIGTGSNKSASISTSLTATGSFQDTYNFTGISGAFNVNSVLSTLIGAARHDIDFTSVTLNGVPFVLTKDSLLGNPDGDELAEFADTSFSNGLTLVVTGTFTAGPSVLSPVATYSGTINVTAVPEPQSYAMLLSGLLVLGWLARRRQIG